MNFFTIFLVLLSFLSISCGKQDPFNMNATASDEQVVTSGRNLLLNGNIQLDDVKVGDVIRLEVESWQVAPKFRDEHRLLYPEDRDELGCWASYRYFDSLEQKTLLPSEALKQLRLMVEGEARPLAPWIKEVKWTDGSILYDLLITPAIADRGEIELEYVPEVKNLVQRIGFVALTSKCPNGLYNILQGNPNNFAFVDQRYNVETKVKISYQLLRN